MKAIALLVPTALLFCTVQASAGAPSFVTNFSVSVTIGGHRFSESIPTPEHMRMRLPVAFNAWNCTATDRNISNDGSEYYVNIVCDPVGHTGFVGVTVSCPVSGVGAGSVGFWLRATDAAGQFVEATFVAACATQAAQSTSSNPSRRL